MTKKLKETETEKVVTLVPKLTHRAVAQRCVCTHLEPSHDGACTITTFGGIPCDCESFRPLVEAVPE